MSETSERERRRSFRVDDDVHMVFRVIKEDSELHQHGEDQTVQTCRALMQLRELGSQSGHILANIRKQHSDIAQYLTLLDKKIEAVAQIAGAMSMGGDMAPNTRVNISVGGLAFSQDSPLVTGQRLAMRIVLFPSHLCIQPKGRVVYSREQPQADRQHRHRIGVEFEPLSEQEQDQLIRHLLEKQSAQRRRERGMDVE